MDELFEQFMIEGRELISQATDELSALEEDASAPGRIDSAFRAVHTLKGSVAIFDLAPMGVALHAAEDLLEQARSGSTALERKFTGALLACLDQCDRWMDAIEESGSLPVDAPKEAVRIATGLVALTGAAADQVSSSQEAEASWVADLLGRHNDRLAEIRSSGADLTAIRYAPKSDCFFSGDDPVALVNTVPELLALSVTPVEPWPPLDEIDPYKCNLLIELVSSASITDLQRLFRFIPDQVEISRVAASVAGAGAGPAVASREAQRTIRVDAAHIDKLLDLVGELVVAKNGLAHLAGLAEAGLDPKAIAAGIRSAQTSTDGLVAEMHETVLAMRMVSLDRVFQRLTRMVREVAQRLERNVAFSVEGSEARVDKAVADALFEPLLHIVRNAVDHGIEDPDARRASGKPAEGRVIIRARAVGDEIAIEIADDGAGIDPDKVRQAAIDRKVGARDEVRALDDDAAIQLIFAPG
ncbi:MAG TPA: Hpt domain-containing protein, partial [Sphingomicrobium sp.]